jgi:hypothetical protein
VFVDKFHNQSDGNFWNQGEQAGYVWRGKAEITGYMYFVWVIFIGGEVGQK